MCMNFDASYFFLFLQKPIMIGSLKRLMNNTHVLRRMASANGLEGKISEVQLFIMGWHTIEATPRTTKDGLQWGMKDGLGKR